MRYSETTNQFYPEEFSYPDIPNDIVTVPDSDFDLAMNRGADEGYTLVDGRIVIVKTVRPLQELQAIKWEEIKASRNIRYDGGVKIGSLWFHSDPESKIKVLGLKALGSDLLVAGATLDTPVTPVPWKTMSGEKTSMTIGLAFDIFQAIMINEGTIFAVAEGHLAAMLLLEDPTNYDYSAGWPEHYAI